ncbi:hypothetical protein FE257_011500 [Aspergillus nanangensis]|uniref:Thioesterase family protein n=1 Tax=Aspergillus nanangensis TaxID=2582783 RepID=A0AAD4CH29_ASPNN|nr:hypothetical protein FE257_011500 [Aspergillus nanangensis]
MAVSTTSPAHTQAFEDAIQLEYVSPGNYSADLKWEWSVGSAPNGGYIAAILHRLATDHFHRSHPKQHHSRPAPINLQLQYVRRSDIGPAALHVRDVKLGARISLIHVTLSQNNREKVVGYVTVSDPVSEKGISTSTGWEVQPRPPQFTPPSQPGQMHSDDGAWHKVTLTNPGFRRASNQLELYEPNDQIEGPGCISQWARLHTTGKGGGVGRWTPETVSFLVDIFPITLGRMEQVVQRDLPGAEVEGEEAAKEAAPVWFPTLGLQIDLKKPAVSGDEWLYTQTVIKAVRDGRMDVQVVVLDQAGELVAVATQANLILSADRNAGKKGKTSL